VVSSPPPPQTNRTRWLIAGLFALALLMRLYGLFHRVYANPDEALWSYFIANTSALPLLSLDPFNGALARLLSWDYGYPFFLFYILYARTLEVLHIPLTEGTLALPLVAMGMGVWAAAGRLGTLSGGPRVGRMMLLWVALMPLTVVWSRSMGAALVLSSLLLLLTVLALLRLYEQPQCPRRAWAVGILFGFYICADLQFPLGLAALATFLWLWPRPAGYEGWGGLRRLVLRGAVIVPPLVLFAPYLPAWLYAIKLGYPDQTYLGTMLGGEHQPDWGWHLMPFIRDLGHNMGLLALAILAVPIALWQRRGDRRWTWLAVWALISSLPFLLMVTSRVTQAWGYHEHLVVVLALLISLALASWSHRWGRRAVIAVLALGTMFSTFGGVWRLEPFIQWWPFQVYRYGDNPPNSGIKTAGYWVRRQLHPDEQVFVAHDPAVAYWYLGRAAITGGHVSWEERARTLYESLSELTAAIVPANSPLYPSETLLKAGLRLRSTVTHRGQAVLYIYSRRHPPQTLTTEEYDSIFNQTYHTARTIIPPGAPYVPDKPLVIPAS
jgi:hypothetical protein